ncbi:MAG TPA: ferritin family protein [Thermoanaerobaculia bacterium]|nr:ferritin family protein [Thermoanaerobaculia bacterium]
MKRTLLVLALSSIALGTIAATNPLPREVRDVLQRALVNEREAVARYEAFARKADEEGYRGAAALFRAQAQAERTHGERFAAMLHAHDVALPPEETFSPAVGTTAENLRTAAAAEKAERDGAYREAVETCIEYGTAEIAKVFDQTRDSEVEHNNLCSAAARDLDSMKAPKTFYVCGKCGYTTDVKLPFCPACQHKVAPAAVE